MYVLWFTVCYSLLVMRTFNYENHSMYIYIDYESVAFLYSIISIPSRVCKCNFRRKKNTRRYVFTCIHFQQQQYKKKTWSDLKKKKKSCLFTMRGRTCRINVMYFISCKLCETEKKITWHYLALFFSSRNKPAAKSCWRATFYTRFDTNQSLYFEIWHHNNRFYDINQRI